MSSDDVYNLVKYENAFNCADCPGTSGPKGCPLWWKYPQENDKGDVRMVETCGLPELPMFLRHLITASNRPAEEFGKVGNQITNAINRLAFQHDERMKQLSNSEGSKDG